MSKNINLHNIFRYLTNDENFLSNKEEDEKIKKGEKKNEKKNYCNDFFSGI